MEELYNLELSDNTVQAMIEYNPNIKNMSKEEIKEKILLLENLNCSNDEVRDIVSSNSRYLGRTNEEIDSLIDTLTNFFSYYVISFFSTL